MAGSIFIVMLMMIVPSISAIQLNIALESKPDVDYIKSMDLDEISNLIIDISKEFPEIEDEIVDIVKEIKNSDSCKDIVDENKDKILSSDGSLKENIWTKIFNYRAFRLYLSLCLYAYFKTKLTLMRSLTWAIKLLRWVKIGTIIGVVDPSPEKLPEIMFQKDDANNTLTIVSVDPDDVQWSDIDEIGSGECDPLPEGLVLAGDSIGNCSGIIVLRYIPMNEVIGIFEFD